MIVEKTKGGGVMQAKYTAMDRLHEDGKPVKRLENRGVVRLDMEALSNRDEAWEALCAADISGFPPADYRERLKRRGLHEKYAGGMDAVFASLLLNLDLKSIESTR